MSKTIANPNLPAPPNGKYPAKAHARRVAKWIADNGGPQSGVIYLEGQSLRMNEDDDTDAHFRQRRHFYYLTGCDLPDCYFAYDIAANRSTLWIPPIDPAFVMWAGMPLLPDQALKRYDVDDVKTSDELLKGGDSIRNMLQKQQTVIMAIKDRANLDLFQSGSLKECRPEINFEWVRKGIEACRVVKDDHEIAMIRHANIVSSYAHEQVLASVKRAKNERELNAVFVMHCHANGCKEQAYGCICAGGSNASTLHYVHNDMPLEGRLNLLLDAGCEYNCYCSDITRTFPLTGTFTKESKEIYTLVLHMQTECMKMIKAGVKWEDVHMKAHALAAEGLLSLGILNKELSVEKILATRVTTRFLPHGLGHYLGMDTHDCGGNPNHDDPDEMFKYLRIRGVLPANSVVTNEPGIYFRKFPLEQELEDGKWDGIIDQEVLKRYWDVGGVRIEDDIWVKEGGCENLTTVKSGLDYVEATVNGS
ncbi:X-Pro dipeptidase [Hortaea werneckii]|nr:X-Pro dipeptidase [Hortaea werneckii]